MAISYLLISSYSLFGVTKNTCFLFLKFLILHAFPESIYKNYFCFIRTDGSSKGRNGKTTLKRARKMVNRAFNLHNNGERKRERVERGMNWNLLNFSWFFFFVRTKRRGFLIRWINFVWTHWHSSCYNGGVYWMLMEYFPPLSTFSHCNICCCCLVCGKLCKCDKNTLWLVIFFS